MTVSDPEFLGFALGGLAVYGNLRAPGARRGFLAAMNLGLLLWLAGGPAGLGPMALFLALGYAVVRGAAWDPRWTAPGVVLLVAVFVYLKQYGVVVGWVPGPGPEALLVGLSYMLFRVVHLVLDGQAGDLEVPGPLAYFTYVTSFLTLFSGPVQGYQEAAAQGADLPEPPDLGEREAHDAVLRVALGLLKLLAICPVLLGRYTYAGTLAAAKLTAMSGKAAGAAWGKAALQAAAFHVVAATGFLLYLYANFSGYMDVVLGLGRLYGYQLPENFDYPLEAENFLDFWRRWHITVSTWFGTYLFNPLLRALIRRWPSRDVAPFLGCVAYMATFFVLGLWHGTTLEYLVIACFFSVGASANRLFQVLAERRLGRKGYAALRRNRAYRLACQVAALAWLIVSIVPMWMPAAEAMQAVGGYGAAGLALFLAGELAACTGLALAASGAASLRAAGAARAAAAPSRWETAGLGLATLAVALLWADLGRTAPRLFYQAF